MSGTLASDSISFSCTHCAMELTVPAERAGVSGPCPQCGELIQSPVPSKEPIPAPLPVTPVSSVQSAKEGARVLPQPRLREEHPEEPSSRGSLPPRRATAACSRGRSIDPITGLSAKYDDEKERGAVIRVALAVLLTVGLVAAVFFLFPEG